MLVALAAVSLALGVSGFLTCDPSLGFVTALYRSVQLFYWGYFPWNTTLEARLPWTLEIARWTAPLTVLWILARVAILLFHRHWIRFRIRRSRDHIIVCGAGQQGTILARDIVAKGKRAVLVESDPEHVAALETGKIPILQGDATLAATLRAAGANEAARLVAAAGDDRTNLAIAMAAAQIGIPEIHMHNSHPSLCDLCQRHRAITPGPESTLHVFNRFRNSARCTLSAFPLEQPTGEVRLILPATTPLGEALLIEAALTGHYSHDRRVHLHLIGPRAENDAPVLLARMPGLTQCLTLETISTPADLFAREAAATVASPEDSLTVVTSLDDEGLGFTRALELLELLRSHPRLRLLLPAAAASPLRDSMARHPEWNNRVGFLPAPETVCGFDAVIGESVDRTARAIHENWLAETRRQIDAARAAGDESLARRHEAKPAFRPWSDLSEELRGANRSQAGHLAVKIRAAGWDPRSVTPAQWQTLPAETLELLARMEHERWAAYLHLTGWVFGTPRDDAAKRHPNLVPFDALDEPTKDYDREAVRHVSDYLSFLQTD